MRTDIFNLLIDCRLGDFALIDVLDQPAVAPDKTNIQLLLRFVPLAADHHAIAISVRLRTWRNWSNHVAGDFADPLK